MIDAVLWLLLAGLILFLQRRAARQAQDDRQVTQHLSRQVEQLERELADCQQALKAQKKSQEETHQAMGLLREQQSALRAESNALKNKLEEQAAQITAAPVPTPPPPAEPGPNESGAHRILGSFQSPLVKDIMQRLSNGQTPREIAREKGMQVGEVALIQSLNKFAPKD